MEDLDNSGSYGFTYYRAGLSKTIVSFMNFVFLIQWCLILYFSNDFNCDLSGWFQLNGCILTPTTALSDLQFA